MRSRRSLSGTLTALPLALLLIVTRCRRRTTHAAHAPGTLTCRGLETFTGTIDSRAGAAEFWNVFDVDLLTGSFSGRFAALGGTGDLANLQGRGTFEGLDGTYALRITFSP